MVKTAKLFFASLLLLTLLALTGLSAFGGAGVASFFQLPTRTLTSGVTPTTATANDQQGAAPRTVSDTQSPPAQVGIIDARTAVRKAGPAVVTVINNMQTSGSGGGFFGNGGSAVASGSGVIVDPKGYIVTNNHVVENQQSLQVIFSDGTKADAKLVGTDPYSDLAVVKVDVAVPAVATFGDSDTLEAGQPVVAIGSALGDFANTVTAGIVSALHRDLDEGTGAPSMQNLIQTDAAINHGNSGGPLLDITGNVIGINVAVVRGSGMTGDVAEGLGFAIPSNTAKDVVNAIITKGAVDRPYMGISYQLINPQIAAYYNLSRESGLLVTDIQAGSPADKAGIQQGDIIIKFDGTDVTGSTSLLELLMKHKVGETIKLTIMPNGATAEKEVSLTLAQRPAGK